MDITVDFQEDVALIKMDDGKLNVITRDAMEQLHAALDKADADSRAIVLAGRPGSFCAGFHLPTMTGPPKGAAELGNAGGEFALRLWHSRKPLFAACTGHGFTIGAIWMACCDTRIGEEGEFQLGLLETRMGLGLPNWALIPLRERIIASEWIPSVVQSRMYDPTGALRAGLLDELVAPGQSIDRACELAAEFAAFPGDGYGATKQKLRAGTAELFRQDLEPPRD